MKAGNSKEKFIVRLSLAILLGIGGYFGFKKLKELKAKKVAEEAEAERLKNNSNNEVNPIITPSNNSTEKATSIAYRIWANSTDALTKKYGKKSVFDLDASSNNPTGGTFPKSYASGKNDFDKYNNTMSKPEVNTATPSAATSKIFNTITGSIGEPIKRLPNGVTYMDVRVSTRGEGLQLLRIADGQLNNAQFSPSYVVYYLYNSNNVGKILGKSIAAGFLRVVNGKYDVIGGNGIGKGAKITGVSSLTQGISGVVGYSIMLR